jgi:hypothetical protein
VSLMLRECANKEISERKIKGSTYNSTNKTVNGKQTNFDES